MAKVKVEHSSYDGFDDEWTAFYEDASEKLAHDIFTFSTIREDSETPPESMPVVAIENEDENSVKHQHAVCRIELMTAAMAAGGWLVLDPQGVSSLRRAYDYLNDQGDVAADQLAEELHEVLKVFERVEVKDA